MAGSDQSWRLRDIQWRKLWARQDYANFLLTACLIVATIVVSVVAEPHIVPYVAWDARISYPLHSNTIPSWVAVFTPLIMLALTIAVGEFINLAPPARLHHRRRLLGRLLLPRRSAVLCDGHLPHPDLQVHRGPAAPQLPGPLPARRAQRRHLQPAKHNQRHQRPVPLHGGRRGGRSAGISIRPHLCLLQPGGVRLGLPHLGVALAPPAAGAAPHLPRGVCRRPAECAGQDVDAGHDLLCLGRGHLSHYRLPARRVRRAGRRLPGHHDRHRLHPARHPALAPRAAGHQRGPTARVCELGRRGGTHHPWGRRSQAARGGNQLAGLSPRGALPAVHASDASDAAP